MIFELDSLSQLYIFIPVYEPRHASTRAPGEGSSSGGLADRMRLSVREKG